MHARTHSHTFRNNPGSRHWVLCFVFDFRSVFERIDYQLMVNSTNHITVSRVEEVNVALLLRPCQRLTSLHVMQNKMMQCHGHATKVLNFKWCLI